MEKKTNKEYDPEEEVAVGDWKIVDLPKIEVKKTEDAHTVLFKARTKIYRMVKKEW